MLSTYQEFEEFLSRCTNYERVQAFKYDKQTLGLERMRSLAGRLGDPQEAYPSVHVAGTKGKGSTSLILEALLRADGHSVGTYLSPHVEHIRERIRVDGASIEEGDLLAEVNRMLPCLEGRHGVRPPEPPSFFELMTAAAMSAFRTRRVDWAVFEVGLGGRLDATNILRPRCAVITSIGLEHTQQLGNTLGAIAREKAGIIKEGTPLFLGPMAPEAESEILVVARDLAAPVTRVDPGAVRAGAPGWLRIRDRGTLPAGAVRGPALRTDLAIALVTFEHLLRTEGRAVETGVLEQALAILRLPARVEMFDTTPPVVVDAAHTLDSVRALRATLDEVRLPRPRVLIFSLSIGKDRDPILRELPSIAEEIVWTLADPVRSMPPEELRDQLGTGTVIPSPEEALEAAMCRGHPVVVTGSFYLAGVLRPLVRLAAETPHSTARCGTERA
ncbi:MAG: hypothetical protein HY721_26940 [Planctomycetes bacterium]|nr:hypothetical protein [Planctomycetota bacterium]